MKERLKIAVAGAGYFSRFHFDAWARCPEVDLVGIAETDQEKAREVAVHCQMPIFENVPEMLTATKPDILDVITPPNTHLDLIKQAAAAGVDVVCQKPFCGDEATAKLAVSVAEQSSTKLIVHENFRFQPWYRAIKTEIESGRLGEIYQVTFRFRPGDGQGKNAYLERQPYFQKMPRFLVHETGVHFIDVFRFLFGEIKTVWAELDRLNPAINGEDRCLISFGFENGVRGVLDGNRLADHKAKNPRLTMGEMQVEGAKGTLSLSGDGEVTFRAHESSEAERIAFDWQDKNFGGDCVYQFTRHVVDAYVTGAALENSAREYLGNLQVEEAVYESAQAGRRVEV